MTQREILTVSTILLSMIGILGCSSTAPYRAYPGAELPESQIARIRVDRETPPPSYSGRTSDKATIRILDGKDIKTMGASGYPTEILVQPGQHEIVARVGLGGPVTGVGALGTGIAASKMDSTVAKWDAPLAFLADPGKTYLIRFEYVKGPESPEKEDYFNRNKGKLWVYWLEEAITREHVAGWLPSNSKK